MILTNARALESDDLILGGPQTSGIEVVINFLEDETGTKGFGHIQAIGDAWRWCAATIGHWHIYEYSNFTIETKSVNKAGIRAIWHPEIWPKPEVSCVVFECCEGKSIAYEAAVSACRRTYEDLGLTTFTSKIAPYNTRSQRFAERMGVVYEKTYKNTHENNDMMLYRHPGLEEVL